MQEGLVRKEFETLQIVTVINEETSWATMKFKQPYLGGILIYTKGKC